MPTSVVTPLKVTPQLASTPVVPAALQSVAAKPSQLSQVGVGIRGPQGLKGSTGSTGASGTNGTNGVNGVQGAAGKTYQPFLYSQLSPSALWSIRHDLGYFPKVTIVDSGGSEVHGDVSYTDLNSVVINFSAAFSGVAYLG
jgi:hypothetical protein